MVHSCAAINCTTRWKKDEKIKFHNLLANVLQTFRIPINEELRKQWLHAIRRINYVPKNAFICEKHFLETDYEMNVHGNRVLKKGAIPSVFNLPDYLKTVIDERTILKGKEIVPGHPDNTDREESTAVSLMSKQIDKRKKNIPESSMAVVEKNPSSRKRKAVGFDDFLESDMENEEMRKRFWEVAHETVSKLKKLNEYYEHKVKKQKTEVENLYFLLGQVKIQQIKSTQLLE